MVLEAFLALMNREERRTRGKRRKRGGLPPGWRGDDRRAPSRENYDDRDKYYLDRERDRGGPRDVGGLPKEARLPPTHDRGAHQEGRDRDMNIDRGPEYWPRDQGHRVDKAPGFPPGEEPSLLARTRDMHGAPRDGGRALMFGRRSGPTPNQVPGWERGEGATALYQTNAGAGAMGRCRGLVKV